MVTADQGDRGSRGLSGAQDEVAEPLVQADASIGNRRHSLKAVLNGAFAGFLSGLFASVVDVASGAGTTEAPLLAALNVASLLLAWMTVGGALGALWLFAVSAFIRASSPALSWLRPALAGLPLLAFVFWVPAGWLSDNWRNLDGNERALAVAVYLIMLAAVSTLARVAWWVKRRYPRPLDRLPWWHWPLFALSALAAGVFYAADRNVFVDLYEDFHYGLAGGFVLSSAMLAVLSSAAFQRFRPAAFQRLTAPRLGPAALWGAVPLAGWLVQLALSPVAVPGALLFSKTASTIQRHSDFDGDGYSAFMGGLDCAPFDRHRGPAAFDLPGNGVDEDCSGSDARWPKPVPKAQYAVPDARGLNLLLITVDTLRPDRMSVYGHTRRTTPNLERLGEQALVFTRAYAQSPKTFDSVPSLFTGLYPSNLPRDYGHKRTRGQKPYLYTLTEDALLLTELLKARGYQTLGFVGLRYLHTLGLDRAFDTFQVTRSVSRGRRYLVKVKEPFFMWLHYLEPHDPYVRHKRHDYGPTALDRYDSEIARVDWLVGGVLTDLELHGLANRTLVVVTADHGEEFGEHGGRFHAEKLHEELLHVPLILSVPGLEAARIDALVELTDLVPALCEALKLRTECADFDGKSLWAPRADRGDASASLQGAYAETLMVDGMFQRRSLRTDSFRLNMHHDTETVALFDVVRDPGEKRDIAAARPRVVDTLREELAYRPYRQLAGVFGAHERPDAAALVRALPRIRSEALLRLAVETLAKEQSTDARKALERLKRRPDLPESVAARLQTLVP